MDECVGLLVRHCDGREECSEDGCIDPDAIHHEWRTTCEVLLDPCRECEPRIPIQESGRFAA
jgi:hypothetical protein